MMHAASECLLLVTLCLFATLAQASSIKTDDVLAHGARDVDAPAGESPVIAHAGASTSRAPCASTSSVLMLDACASVANRHNVTSNKHSLAACIILPRLMVDSLLCFDRVEFRYRRDEGRADDVQVVRECLQSLYGEWHMVRTEFRRAMRCVRQHDQQRPAQSGNVSGR